MADEAVYLKRKIERLEAEVRHIKKAGRKRAKTPATGPEASTPTNASLSGLDIKAMRNAVILSEIIGPPVSKRRR